MLASLLVPANTVIPSICKLIHKLESHASDGVSQNSLYLKITVRPIYCIFSYCTITQSCPFHLCGFGHCNCDDNQQFLPLPTHYGSISIMQIFRWTNTAIIISIITPFTLTLSEGDGSLLPTVLAIFLAEIFTSPLLRMLDLGGQFQKHYLGK